MDLGAGVRKLTLGAFAVSSIFGSSAASAQQVTGTLGSPSATTTIDGKYLPPPPQKFDGDIQLNALLKELQSLFMTEAAKYNVLPLDNSGFGRWLTPRPSATAGKTEFIYTGENAGIPTGDAPSILNRDYTITAEITVPDGGAEGMLVTDGGRFGGYGLYLLKGKPVFVYNMLDPKTTRWEGGAGGRIGEALKPGKHTLVFDFKYGAGPGKGGTGVLSVDGKELDRKTVEHTIPLTLALDETFDVGIDTGSGPQLRAAIQVH